MQIYSNRTKEYQLPILMYHRLVNSKSEAGRHNIFVTKERFRRQLEYLKSQKIKTLTFNDIVQNPNSNFKKSVILTFDDGYEDNYTILFPLLKEYGFKAVIFLVTRQKQNIWGIREGEPVLSLLSKEQILEMDKYGIEFGAHTQNHPDLLRCADDQVKLEIEGSKKDLENLLKKKIISFAYPFGGLNENIKKSVLLAGFSFGISTNTGPYQLKEDYLQIRRIEVSSRTVLFSFKRKVSGYYFKPSFFSLFSSK